MNETPESLYDKLGDLLSRKLDSGVIFFNVAPEPHEAESPPPERESNPSENEPSSDDIPSFAEDALPTDDDIPSFKDESAEENAASPRENQSSASKKSPPHGARESTFKRADSARRAQPKKKARPHPSFFRAHQQRTGYEIFRFPNIAEKIPEEVKNALALFSLPTDCTVEQAKKAYREKLMYFHPDKWSDNPVLQKISKEKTEQILSSWKILESWFAAKNGT